jgi:outer membrane receptor protein involved in Fe transport
VRGGEIGLKSRLLDRSLNLNVAGYYYKYRGLQVGATEPSTGDLPVTRTINAGSAKVYGVDFDASYRPPAIAGLSLNASVNWNHARFVRLENAPCYGGQTQADGCFIKQIGSGTAPVQDLSGIPLVRAPRWQAAFGFDYDLPVGEDMRLVFGNSNDYSSRFLAGLGRRADLYQKAYIKANAYVTLKGAEDRWEVSLIGNNLNNEITSGNRATSNYANSVLLAGQNNGNVNNPGPAGIDEALTFNEPGRTVFIKLTLRPMGLFQ